MASSFRSFWSCALRVVVCNSLGDCIVGFFPQTTVGAKEIPVNAIELYDGPNGAATYKLRNS